MSIKERVESLQEAAKSTEVRPTKELQRVLVKSGVEKVVEDFKRFLGDSKVTKEIQEEGKKMYIEIIWPQDNQNEYNRIVISVRETSIKFMGSSNPEQFIELEQGDMVSKDLMEDSLVQTFFHPSIIRKC
jgi:hypothetical protein